MSSPAALPRMLVGFDGSDDAVAALSYGVREAIARSGDLEVVYAVDDTALNSAWGIVFDVEAVTKTGQELLEQARAIAHEQGLPPDHVHTECLVGHPGTVLSRQSEHAALLVVGRRAAAGDGAMFVGSTAVAVAGAASCPVVCVSALNADRTPTGQIVVGLDTHGQSRLCLEWALRRAHRVGAKVRVVSIVSRPSGLLLVAGPSEQQKREVLNQARQRLEGLVAPLREEIPSVPLEVEVRFGTPADELVAESAHADLLIIGVHPTFPTYAVGGTVRSVMAHARCPLGLVRH